MAAYKHTVHQRSEDPAKKRLRPRSAGVDVGGGVDHHDVNVFQMRSKVRPRAPPGSVCKEHAMHACAPMGEFSGRGVNETYAFVCILRICMLREAKKGIELPLCMYVKFEGEGHIDTTIDPERDTAYDDVLPHWVSLPLSGTQGDLL